MADPFDALIDVERQFVLEGEELGKEAGELMGYNDGKDIGLARGFECGSEVGFYLGCCYTWFDLSERFPNLFSDKAMKALVALHGMVTAFPLKNDLSDDLVSRLQGMRAKFKVITSLLGVQFVFNKKEIQMTKEMTF